MLFKGGMTKFIADKLYAAIGNVVNSFNGRKGAVVLGGADVTGALGFTPENAATAHVNTFNGRSGAVVPTSTDVTGAIGFTPLDSAEKGAASGIASLDASGNLVQASPVNPFSVGVASSSGHAAQASQTFGLIGMKMASYLGVNALSTVYLNPFSYPIFFRIVYNVNSVGQSVNINLSGGPSGSVTLVGARVPSYDGEIAFWVMPGESFEAVEVGGGSVTLTAWDQWSR